jgi:4-hydroxy-3-polyprenylbenzoate decarboxylase
MAVAGGGGIMPAFPVGYDELGMAGGIQGAPVDICRAKTVDAYAIANAEWVIEGFMDTSQVVWESDEAEKTKDYRAPFFPEAHGHQGRALRTYKVQVTGITHRSDRPIFYAPIGHSFEYPNMSTFVNDAALLKLLNNLRPGLVTDVNSLVGMMGFQGVVIQVKKERRRDDEHINQLILNAFALGASLHWVIVVDEDVDIYDANDVMWALSSRVDGSGDVMVLPPSRGFAGTKGSHGPTAPVSRMGFNATAPWDEKWEYFRGEFPEINLNKWFTDAQVKKLQAQQSEYAKVLAHKRV